MPDGSAFVRREGALAPPRPANRGGTTYATPLASGLDGLKETFNLAIHQHAWELLTEVKAEALESDARGKGLAPITLGGETFQVHAHGRRGSAFLLTSDYFDVVVRAREMEWSVSVEYRAVALWSAPLDTLRDRVGAILADLGRPVGEDWRRLSGIHWCVDFYSPLFSEEIGTALFNQWVCVSKVKKKIVGEMHGAGERVETMTVGSKSGLQVQIYDKGREIREVSGKEWMADVYRANGHQIHSLDNIWRVELRFSSDYLKNRNIRTLDQFLEFQTEILWEGMTRRRLATPTEDTNRARWPLHPLWDAAITEAGNPAGAVPVGRVVVGRREDLLQVAEAGIAGYLRSAVVLDVGAWDVATLEDLARRAVERAISDPKNEKKIDKALERYRFVDCGR